MADYYFEFSGVQGHDGVTDMKFGGNQMPTTDLTVLKPRATVELLSFGWFGSILNTRGIDAAFNTIINAVNVKYIPGSSRLLMWGHSAGAANILDLARKFDTFNANGTIKVSIDLMVTVDAAARDRTDQINRTVGNCVKRNVNFWQDESWWARQLHWSRGADNTGPCKPDNRRLSGKHTVRGKLEEVSHTNIPDITAADSLVELQKALT